MRKIQLIWIVFILYLISMGLMVYLVYDYIEKKDNRLYCEISNSINDAFDKYCTPNKYHVPEYFIDDLYVNELVKFKQIKVPPPPRKDKYDELYKEWKDMYGGIYKMYKLNYRNSEREKQFQPENGWCLIEKSTHCENIYIEFIFPYAVGYYAPDPFWGYKYFPSVEDAINEAYDFFTTDSKYKLEEYNKGVNRKVFDEIIQSNEYYYIAEGANQNGMGKQIGRKLFCEVDTIKKDLWTRMTPDAYEYTYMYNGYYKVYIAKTQPKVYSIKKFNWNPDVFERNELLIKWSIIISSIFIIIEIILIISEIKRRKRLKEPIYDKLLRVCNPGNFIKPHDTNKFEIATNIYIKLQDISKEDVAGINNIQKEIVVKLGVDLIDKEERRKLLKVINPKRWMNPYNEEKIKLANELYVKLNAQDLTYSEFILIKKQAKEQLT